MNISVTVAQLDEWGKWYQAMTDLDGYRLNLLVIGEYWSPELDKLEKYIDLLGMLVSLFDVPFHYHLFEVANSNRQYDMRNIFEGTLAKTRAALAITFVDNHDTQEGQSLKSWVEGWFRVHACACILLRKAGMLVFWRHLWNF